jgi:hemerythrin superfamily protein
MIKTNAVFNVLVSEHKHIEKYLQKFKFCLANDVSLVEKEFKSFNWLVEKHFFTEESKIFTHCDFAGRELNEMVQNVIMQHEMILKVIKDIQSKLKDSSPPDILQLEKLLLNHKHYEERTLYPLIEDRMNELSKKNLIQEVRS